MHKFQFDFGHIVVDDSIASQAEIMDILLEQQSKINRLEHTIDLLDTGETKRTYGRREIEE